MRSRRGTKSWRERVAASVRDPFSHASNPLGESLSFMGDPGLFGPDSVTWPVIGDIAAFAAGLRALIVQAAHPEVVAGIVEHSSYRTDPLGRLSRTSAYVTATAFGALPEVRRAIAVVRDAHLSVEGSSHRGRSYTARDSELAAWVHNALVDSFLECYQHLGPRRLTAAEADRFVEEQARVGCELHAEPLPRTAASLSSWLCDHPQVGPSPGMSEVLTFLHKPPLPRVTRSGYRILLRAAVATIPPRLRRVLGLRRTPGALLLGRWFVRFLRGAMGSSPAWQLALVRAGAPVPAGLFRSPLPTEHGAA